MTSSTMTSSTMTRSKMTPRLLPLLLSPLALLGCEVPQTPVIQALPASRGGDAGVAAARVNGPIGASTALGNPIVTYGTVRPSPAAIAEAAQTGSANEPGDISLDFVDTDIREIVAQTLGTILHVNYTIDPSVRGTATLRTVNPIPRSRVLSSLQAVLSQNGATILENGGLYRVAPAAIAAGAPGLAAAGVAGSAVVPLRYASADDLAKVLQPYAGASGRISPDPGRNALLISGDPTTREALLNLVHAFDIDALAGQSYALFPVSSGTARDFGTAMTEAMRSGQGAALSGIVRVVPMERINAVLLVSAQPRYIDDARRIYALVERSRRQTVRGWSVFYLQNSKSNDVAYVLQQAFTPNHVTATPSARAIGATARRSGGTNSFNSGGGGGGSSGGSALGGSGSSLRSGSGGLSGGSGTQDASQSQPAPGQNPANPLLGGLDPAGGAGGGGGQGGGTDADLNTIRIIPNAENNAVLLYATPAEHDTIEAMLHKIDILPLQVRIDAVIAEVTLNDSLSYGTQFFFKGGGINGALNFNSAATLATQGALASSFPGFVLAGGTSETYALSALAERHHGQGAVLPAAYGARQRVRPPPGRQSRSLPDHQFAEHADRQLRHHQLDRLPRDRRHHGGHPAREQRRPRHARHRPGSQRRRHHRHRQLPDRLADFPRAQRPLPRRRPGRSDHRPRRPDPRQLQPRQ